MLNTGLLAGFRTMHAHETWFQLIPMRETCHNVGFRAVQAGDVENGIGLPNEKQSLAILARHTIQKITVESASARRFVFPAPRL